MKLVIRSKVSAPKGYSFCPFMDGVTQSMLGTWLSCRERARMSIINGFTTSEAKWPLIYGALSHECLDRFYSQELPSDVDHLRSICRDALSIILEKEAPTSEHQEMAHEASVYLSIILPAYQKKWASHDRKVNWTAVEKQFRIPFEKNGYSMVGKMDGGFETSNQHWLLETKNKSRFDSKFEEWLGIDMQLGYYLEGYEYAVKVSPVGALYNLMRRPNRPGKVPLTDMANSLKLDIVKRPDHYFQRYRVTFTKKELVRHRTTIHYKLRQFVEWFKEAKQIQFDPMYNPNACEQFGSKCKFLAHCASGDKTGLIIKPRPHMELEEWHS